MKMYQKENGVSLCQEGQGSLAQKWFAYAFGQANPAPTVDNMITQSDF